MTRKQLGLAAILVGVAVVLASRAMPSHPKHPHLAAQDHPPEGVDFKSQKILAIAQKLAAIPPGKNPCDTAYVQALAYNEAAASEGLNLPFPVMPERQAFLDRCNSVPVDAQICMQPLYNMQHEDECEPIRRKSKGAPLPPASGSVAPAPAPPPSAPAP